MKQENYNGYKVGAAKRRFGMGRADFEPGSLINKMNSQKVTTAKEVVELPPKKRVSIMGMI